MVRIVAVVVLGILAAGIFHDGFKVILNFSLYKAIAIGFLCGGSFIVGPALYSIWRRHPFPQEDLAEEIFTVMGWKNVTDINLAKLNRRRKRQWKRTGKPPNPYKDQSPFLYTGWARDFYFY